LLLWVAARVGGAGGAAGGGGKSGVLLFGSGPWRIKWPWAMCQHPGLSFPPAPSSTERRHRGGGATVCVAPGDGLRWASISKLLVMLVSSMGRRFGSFKADPARTTYSGRFVRFVISSFLEEREDDLRVPLGCSFRAICLGGSGDGFVGKKIRGRW